MLLAADALNSALDLLGMYLPWLSLGLRPVLLRGQWMAGG